MHQKNVAFDISTAEYKTNVRMPRGSIPSKTFRKLADDEFVEGYISTNQRVQGSFKRVADKSIINRVKNVRYIQKQEDYCHYSAESFAGIREAHDEGRSFQKHTRANDTF